MIYKVLFVVGLVWLFRILFRNISKFNKVDHQSRSQTHDDAVEAEYKVVDEDK